MTNVDNIKIENSIIRPLPHNLVNSQTPTQIIKFVFPPYPCRVHQIEIVGDSNAIIYAQLEVKLSGITLSSNEGVIGTQPNSYIPFSVSGSIDFVDSKLNIDIPAGSELIINSYNNAPAINSYIDVWIDAERIN